MHVITSHQFWLIISLLKQQSLYIEEPFLIAQALQPTQNTFVKSNAALVSNQETGFTQYKQKY